MADGRADNDKAPAPSELEAQAVQSLDVSGRKFLLFIAVAALCVAVFHLTPLREYLTDVQQWRARVAESGIWGLLLFFLVITVLIAMGVPRLIFCALAGLLFGFGRGLLVAQAGCILGSYGTFLFARWAGRPWVSKKMARHEKLKALVENPTFGTVVLVRQLPITCAVPNTLFGVTRIGHGLYLVGTFVGMLPSTVIVTLIGSGLGKESLQGALFQISLAMAGLSLVAILLWRLRGKLGERRPAV